MVKAPHENGNFIVFTDRRQATRPLEEVVAAAVDAGARLVVLREEDLPDDERQALAERLRSLVGERLVLTGVDYPGRFCHSLAELVAAEGAPFATLSPIFPTRSKPGYGPPLGLAGLARLCCAAKLPVYALGGVDSPERVRACLAQGASGVAVMGAVMRAADPARTVKELVWW
jgi:thiamine-phosphate pyrophosphorylase